jgi:hypothetical protein
VKKSSSGGVAVSEEVVGLSLGADGAGRLVAGGGRGLRLRRTFQITKRRRLQHGLRDHQGAVRGDEGTGSKGRRLQGCEGPMCAVGGV